MSAGRIPHCYKDPARRTAAPEAPPVSRTHREWCLRCVTGSWPQWSPLRPETPFSLEILSATFVVSYTGESGGAPVSPMSPLFWTGALIQPARASEVIRRDPATGNIVRKVEPVPGTQPAPPKKAPRNPSSHLTSRSKPSSEPCRPHRAFSTGLRCRRAFGSTEKR